MTTRIIPPSDAEQAFLDEIDDIQARIIDSDLTPQEKLGVFGVGCAHWLGSGAALTNALVRQITGTEFSIDEAVRGFVNVVVDIALKDSTQ